MGLAQGSQIYYRRALKSTEGCNIRRKGGGTELFVGSPREIETLPPPLKLSQLASANIVRNSIVSRFKVVHEGVEGIIECRSVANRISGSRGVRSVKKTTGGILGNAEEVGMKLVVESSHVVWEAEHEQILDGIATLFFAQKVFGKEVENIVYHLLGPTGVGHEILTMLFIEMALAILSRQGKLGNGQFGEPSEHIPHDGPSSWLRLTTVECVRLSALGEEGGKVDSIGVSEGADIIVRVLAAHKRISFGRPVLNDGRARHGSTAAPVGATFTKGLVVDVPHYFAGVLIRSRKRGILSTIPKHVGESTRHGNGHDTTASGKGRLSITFLAVGKLILAVGCTDDSPVQFQGRSEAGDTDERFKGVGVEEHVLTSLRTCLGISQCHLKDGGNKGIEVVDLRSEADTPITLAIVVVVQTIERLGQIRQILDGTRRR